MVLIKYFFSTLIFLFLSIYCTHILSSFFFGSMETILEKYERYSYAEKQLTATDDTELQVVFTHLLSFSTSHLFYPRILSVDED